MKTHTYLITILILLSSSVFASQGSSVASPLAHEWDIANYQLTGDQQAEAFEQLISHVNALKITHPDNAEVLIWEGIIKSTYAGIKGGLGALSLVKESRRALEQAIDINANALNGAAYTSLGTLYSKVPGWPLAFGDDKKAKKLLEKALEMNPQDIDANFFYAEYLLEHDKPEKAKHYLLTAKQAKPRPNRQIGDKGRKAEIETALQGVDQVLLQ